MMWPILGSRGRLKNRNFTFAERRRRRRGGGGGEPADRLVILINFALGTFIASNQLYSFL